MDALFVSMGIFINLPGKVRGRRQLRSRILRSRTTTGTSVFQPNATLQTQCRESGTQKDESSR